MRYLKLFENFEENKIPKSITVKITKEAKRGLGLKCKFYQVTLESDTDLWMRMGDDLPDYNYTGGKVHHFYAKWVPENEEILVQKILTNPPSLPEEKYGTKYFFNLPTMYNGQVFNKKNGGEISYWFDKLTSDERTKISSSYLEKTLWEADSKGELGIGGNFYCKFDKPNNYEVGKTDHRGYFEIVSLQ